jgi:molybdopterin molybdotransferase
VSALLLLEDAQAQLLALAPPVREERVATADALGRMLARDLTAARTQPPSDLSAMDGYALAGAGPWQVRGEARAGASFTGVLAAGEAVRIATGAVLPRGADRVLIQEEATCLDDRLITSADPAPGLHVRQRGFDFTEGQKLLETGTALSPAGLALALSAGHRTLCVARQPRVAVLESGDELAPDPENLAPGQIPASNGPMLAAMLAPLVGKPLRIGPVPDDANALADALDEAGEVDILITSGGASVGERDLIRPALEAWGANIAFWKVAIRPGKPLLVATREACGRRQVILGLPGNPVSSFVTAHLFALPLCRAAMGDPAAFPVAQLMEAQEALPAIGSRRTFARGIAEGGKVRLAGSQDSSALAALAAANCLIEREPNAPEVPPGGKVVVQMIRNG